MIPAKTVSADDLVFSWTSIDRVTRGLVMLNEGVKDIVLFIFGEALIYSSFRRRPESMSLKTLDPGIRRDDRKGINQRFPRAIWSSLKSNVLEI